jgi:hypothetical protein
MLRLFGQGPPFGGVEVHALLTVPSTNRPRARPWNWNSISSASAC